MFFFYFYLKRTCWWCWRYSNWEKDSHWAELQLQNNQLLLLCPHYLGISVKREVSLGGRRGGLETELQPGLPAATLPLISQVLSSCSRVQRLTDEYPALTIISASHGGSGTERAPQSTGTELIKFSWNVDTSPSFFTPCFRLIFGEEKHRGVNAAS